MKLLLILYGEMCIRDRQSIQVTESIAYAALTLLLIGVIIFALMQRSKIAKKP